MTLGSVIQQITVNYSVMLSSTSMTRCALATGLSAMLHKSLRTYTTYSERFIESLIKTAHVYVIQLLAGNSLINVNYVYLSRPESLLPFNGSASHAKFI
jgi:hypothetical protein